MIQSTKEYIFASKIISNLGKNNNELVVAEFGAWDGIRKSNIRQFVLNNCKNGIFIEPDKSRFKKLKKNYNKFDNVILINSFVNTSGKKSFDNLMKKYSINYIDFLSIDIDGNDYHAFDSISEILPKLVCIEFNPTIPFKSLYVQENNFSIGQGSSLESLKKLFKKKGYIFLSVVEANAFFLKENLISEKILQIAKNENKKYFSIKPIELYVGFDGSFFSNEKNIYLNWHKLSVPVESLSPVPKFFRSIPAGFPILKKIFYFLWLAYKRPKKISLKNIKFLVKNLIN